jgi:hypothetical protein
MTTINSIVKAIELSSAHKMYVAIVENEVLDRSANRTDQLFNLGGATPAGSIFIESNPGQAAIPMRYIYQQVSDAKLVRGIPPEATYEATFRAIQVPNPRSLRQVIETINEGLLVQYSLNERGVLTVPAGRRQDVLSYLGLLTS